MQRCHVMAGPVPTIHVFSSTLHKSWMLGTSPGMTTNPV
jgi:hypothetical protein